MKSDKSMIKRARIEDADCELDNIDSFRFHMALGFEEANRIICFRKDL